MVYWFRHQSVRKLLFLRRLIRTIVIVKCRIFEFSQRVSIPLIMWEHKKRLKIRCECLRELNVRDDRFGKAQIHRSLIWKLGVTLLLDQSAERTWRRRLDWIANPLQRNRHEIVPIFHVSESTNIRGLKINVSKSAQTRWTENHLSLRPEYHLHQLSGQITRQLAKLADVGSVMVLITAFWFSSV
jgi:hypothetical protein